MSHIRYIDDALCYIYDKIFQYLSKNEYVEGTYNDNRLVELCWKCYKDCIIESYNDGIVSAPESFDSQDLSKLVWEVVNDEIGVKVYKYFKDKNGVTYDSTDKEFGEKQKQYIDWTFSNGSDNCEWCKKYIDVVGHWLKNKPPCQKWYKNKIHPEYDEVEHLKQRKAQIHHIIIDESDIIDLDLNKFED